MSLKERWAGSKVLRTEYKQKAYAMKDKYGQEEEQEGRAEAMAEYLAEIHWGRKPIRKKKWIQEVRREKENVTSW